MITALLLLAAEGVAEPEEAEGLSGHLELSAANATGNAENLTLGGRAEIEYEKGRVGHRFDLAGNYAEAGPPGGAGDRIRTQANWFAAYRLDADISDKTFGYGDLRYEEDEFSGFEQRAAASVGLGRHLFEKDAVNWTVTGGVGVRYAQVEPDADMMQQRQDGTEAALFASSDLEWDIRENVGLTHEAAVTAQESNTTLVTEAGVKSKLTEVLALRVSYRVVHETDPVAGRQATDTFSRIGLTVDF